MIKKNSKNLVKISMENYLSKENYDSSIKRKIISYLGFPLCKGYCFDMKFDSERELIFQEIYHKKGSTILLEEEEIPSNKKIRASILIAYDDLKPLIVIENLKNLHPDLKLENNQIKYKI